MIRDATIDPTGVYRYTLSRDWAEQNPLEDALEEIGAPSTALGPAETVLWIMLNPSTADAREDDPTIRRCIGFTKSWGYKRLVVVNLFAMRQFDPNVLESVIKARGAAAAIGPDNDRVLLEECRFAKLIVAAWGARGILAGRDLAVRRMLAKERIAVYHVGLTANGHPRHPLYVRAVAPPTLWCSLYAIADPST